MCLKFTLFTFIAVLLTNSAVQASTCSPIAQAGLRKFSKQYIQFLCQGKPDCIELGQSILEDSTRCVETSKSIKVWRKQVTSFMRDDRFRRIVEHHFLLDDPSGWREKIWKRFGVLVLPGGLKSPYADTKEWSESDLSLLYSGYEKLQEAITHAVGKERLFEFSHIWGEGGTLALSDPMGLRPGMRKLTTQFGEVINIYAIQIKVVTSVTEAGYTSEKLAQRLAHENGHSQDYILGALRNNIGANWTETTGASIFKSCELPASYKTNLGGCFKKHPHWFNFHPSTDPNSNYAADTPAEFYTKMIDEWVRENLKLTKKAVDYRCQSPETLRFWSEMEVRFLGEILSKDCK